MKEYQFAKQLENEYLKAKKEFEHFTINHSLKHLEEELKLNFDILKYEVEKLGYHLSLAKDIKNKFWQREWKDNQAIVFYATEEDL